jgi:hypothetical protein
MGADFNWHGEGKCAVPGRVEEGALRRTGVEGRLAKKFWTGRSFLLNIHIIQHVAAGWACAAFDRKKPEDKL